MKNKVKLIEKKICILGSGLAGGTLAIELSNCYESVLLVEAGDFSKSDKTAGTKFSPSMFGLPKTRHIGVGGTSRLWHGVLGVLDEIDFSAREVLGSPGWPIALQDLKPYYKQAEILLGIKNYSLIDDQRLHHLVGVYRNDLDLDFSRIDNKIFRQRDPCFDFSKVLSKAFKNNIKILCNHTALEFKYSKGEVTSLICGTEDGTVAISADIFILACGALESPRILLNSGISNHNIGKNLMDHPMGNVCQVRFSPPIFAPIYSDMRLSIGQKVKSGIVLKKSEQKRLGLLNNNLYFRPSFTPGLSNKSDILKNKLLLIKSGKLKFNDYFELLINVPVILQILIYKLSLKVKFKYAEVFVVSEQTPSETNKISLGDDVDQWGYRFADVNWSYSDEEHKALLDWYVEIEKTFPSRKISRVTALADKDLFTSAAHHLGTCRMGINAKDSVVDKNLKVHNFDNLYICDGSVFPSGGNVNPGLTIVALALKLVDYLRKL